MKDEPHQQQIMADLALQEPEESPAPEDVLEDSRLRAEFVEDVREALDRNDADRVQFLVSELHPADIADLIEQVPADERGALIVALGDSLDGDVIAELNDWVRDEVVAELTPHEIAEAVTDLDTDDAVAILEDMDQEQQQEVLRAMPSEDRAVLEDALGYGEDSAGRLMQRDLIAVPSFWSVGQVIDMLRDEPDLTTDFWEIFVVDVQHKPVGTIRLSVVLRSQRHIIVSDIMQEEQTLIPADMDQEEVAYKFQQYHLISAAVVDSNGRLVGMITVDDIVNIIQEEAQEDVLRLAGAGEGDINQPFWEMTKGRLWWLFINFWTAVFAAAVISPFQDAIGALPILGVVMGIVTGMGGNGGTQTTTVVVRALATRQLTASNAWRVFLKELKASTFNGVALAILCGLLIAFWSHNVPLGWVIAAAMVINLVSAAVAGVLVPVLLDRFNIDPAVASTVFVTTVTDSIGFFAFLGIAVVSGIVPHAK